MQTDSPPPKLHPWNVKDHATDFDATVVDGMNDRSIISWSIADSYVDNKIILLEEDNTQLRDHHGTDNFQKKDLEFGDTTI